MRQFTDKRKIENQFLRILWKTIWAIENFLIKINWGFFLKNNSWPTLCHWTPSSLCKGLFCAPIRKSFLKDYWSLSVSRYAFINCKFVKNLKDCIVLGYKS